MDTLLLVDDPQLATVSDELLLEAHRLEDVGEALPLERLEQNQEHYQRLFERHQHAAHTLQAILERYRLVIAHGRRMIGRWRSHPRQFENRPQLSGPASPVHGHGT